MRSRAVNRLPIVLVVLTVAACDMSVGHLAGRATDEWTHTYPLAAGGELRVGNTNGRVEVEGADGASVEIRAEKIARAATDAGASELLPRIVIREEVKPDRVSIETERMSGIMIGASFEVRYHIRAPRNAVVNVTNTNGTVVLSRLAGKVTARTTNGTVSGRELTGAVDARTTNGSVNVDLSAVGAERIALATTNGGLTLRVPETAKADITASWTNGGINLSNVKMEVSERGRRRFEGRMNGGGTPIELRTTNGGIRIRNRDDAPDGETDKESDHDPDKSAPRPPRPPEPPRGERR